jgi:hypothetical protein
MSKPFLCALLFFSAVAGAAAQSTTPAGSSGKSVVTFSGADTTRAIHTLFGKRRTGGFIWTGVGAAFAARILLAGASADNASGTLVGTVVLGGVPAAIGVGKLTRFSESKEEQTVAFYEKTKHLPPYVKRRLKRKYFNW